MCVISFVDYDAPVAENGELTDKWYLTRRLLQELLPDQGLLFSQCFDTLGKCLPVNLSETMSLHKMGIKIA